VTLWIAFFGMLVVTLATLVVPSVRLVEAPKTKAPPERGLQEVSRTD
jgi:hypothetical protein